MGPRTHLWFSACKIACLASEWQVSMGPSLHVWFLDAKQRLMDQNNKSLRVPDIDLSFCACKTAWFAPEWYVYMVSSPHLCLFFMQNSDFMTRLRSIYGSQISSVVLSTHNSVLSTRINRVYWFHPSPVVLCMQNGVISTWITSLYESLPSSVFFECKTASFGPELQVSMCRRPYLSFGACTMA